MLMIKDIVRKRIKGEILNYIGRGTRLKEQILGDIKSELKRGNITKKDLQGIYEEIKKGKYLPTLPPEEKNEKLNRLFVEINERLLKESNE